QRVEQYLLQPDVSRLRHVPRDPAPGPFRLRLVRAESRHHLCTRVRDRSAGRVDQYLYAVDPMANVAADLSEPERVLQRASLYRVGPRDRFPDLWVHWQSGLRHHVSSERITRVLLHVSRPDQPGKLSDP